ncbi:MAG: hypothetical protein H0X53_08945, partial [Sphingomonas sp.]|nr:hypothetical protein [Sphingomonas sp.]
MLLDAGGPDRAAFERSFDICVIGSGPAGMTLARSLAAQGLDVALMEGGALELTPESQDVYVGANVGLPYHDLDEARVRMFGGSSYHWNGACRELDPGDFRDRPNTPLGAWPIGKADLDPWQPGADDILDVSSTAGPDPPLRQSGDVFRLIHYRFSPPTRFGEKYAGEIDASERIFLALNANLVDLRLDAGLRRIEGAVFKSYVPGDPGFTVRARRYALCCGGIDNARLLLNFTSPPRGGSATRTTSSGAPSPNTRPSISARSSSGGRPRPSGSSSCRPTPSAPRTPPWASSCASTTSRRRPPASASSWGSAC